MAWPRGLWCTILGSFLSVSAIAVVSIYLSTALASESLYKPFNCGLTIVDTFSGSFWFLYKFNRDCWYGLTGSLASFWSLLLRKLDKTNFSSVPDSYRVLSYLLFVRWSPKTCLTWLSAAGLSYGGIKSGWIWIRLAIEFNLVTGND